MRPHSLTLLLAMLALACWACDKAQEELESSPPPPAEEPGVDPTAPGAEAPTEEAGGYQVIEVADGGTITGRVVFKGKAKPLTMSVSKDADTCGTKQKLPRLVLGKRGGVANAFVYLEKVSRGVAFADAPVVLDQQGCVFVPHAQVASLGGTLEIRNSDPILHNTHGYINGRTVFNLAMPIQNQRIKKKLKEPGVLEVVCDVGHVWMSSYTLVAGNPYATTTDKDGGFEINDIPAGTYELSMWHEGWEVEGRLIPVEHPKFRTPITETREVTVPAQGSVSVDFVLKG